MSLFFLDQQTPIEKIDCLIVNIGQSELVVPMPAVAEIIHNQPASSGDKLPQWVAGWVEWRHLNIPLIDFTAMQQDRPASDFGSSTRILVLHSFCEGHSHKYYAILSKGFPHTLQFEADADLSGTESTALQPCIKIELALEGKKFSLPDFEAIEPYLAKIPLYF
jgi:chemosensory pili system protein ChpC